MKQLILFFVALIAIIIIIASGPGEYSEQYTFEESGAVLAINETVLTITFNQAHYYNVQIDMWGVSIDVKEVPHTLTLVNGEHLTWGTDDMTIWISDATTGISEAWRSDNE